jgi:hypothetical protein
VAVEQAIQTHYKEMMGPLGPPVAAKVAEIVGQKAEELVREEEEFKGPLTCVIMPGRENAPPPLEDVGDGDIDSLFRENESPQLNIQVIPKDSWFNVDFYRDEGIKLILNEFEARRRMGEIIAYAEYYHFNPSSIGAGIAECTTQREGGSGTGPFWPFLEERGQRFDRIIIFTHAFVSRGPGRDAWDYPVGGPNISEYIPPDIVYSEVGPYLKEGGELIVICCGQWQAEWEGYADYTGISFFVTIWPGEGRCADAGEVIDMIQNKMERSKTP